MTKVRCPACGRETEWSPANRYRPFCSERCRTADLGGWFSERYRISSPAAPEDLEDETLARELEEARENGAREK